MSSFARGLALALACISTQPAASPESDALVRRGLMEFEAQRFRDAIHFFGEAVRADPKDLRAVFLQGAALNRLGNYREAYLLVSGVERQGGRHPEMDFEAGWALMGIGRSRACIDRLERFDKAYPGRGQTSEFLGRCYLQLREYERAESHFNEAIKREPKLKPSVDLSMARLEQARNRPGAARDRLQAAADANAPTGRALRNVFDLPEPVYQPEKPLQLSAALSVGHNDNVIGLGSTIPLPSDITRQGANFIRAQVAAAYSRALTSSTTATAGYALLVDRYKDLGLADLNDHFFYGDLAWSLPRGVGGSLRVSHEITDVHGDRFREQSALRPALSYRFTENSVTELALQHSWANYHGPTAPTLDRDGFANALSLTHLFRVPRSGWSGNASATYLRNHSRGGDFRFTARGADGALRYTFTNAVGVLVGYGYTNYDYSELNSLTNFGLRRQDDQHVARLELAGPIRPGLRWVVQAQRLSNESNIPFFDFVQNVVSAGVAANF
jgi:tetratricopeptide (TPR) repeat protein